MEGNSYIIPFFIFCYIIGSPGYIILQGKKCSQHMQLFDQMACSMMVEKLKQKMGNMVVDDALKAQTPHMVALPVVTLIWTV